ncbi:MAG: hypothetical protein J6T54_02875 [Fibrobacter sp.]|nr:hypothetical protein [Fibrobacter sp.]
MNRQQREELLDSINLLENSRDEYLHSYAGVSVHDRTVRSVQLRKALENVKRPFAQLCEKMKTNDWLYLPFDLPEPARVRDSELTYFGFPPKTLSQLIMLIAASVKKQNVTVLSICTRNLAVYEMMFGFWNVPQKDNLDERVAAITDAEEKTGALFDKASEEFERILKMTDLVKTQMVSVSEAEQSAKAKSAEAAEKVAEIQSLTEQLDARKQGLEELKESLMLRMTDAEDKDRQFAEKIESAQSLIDQACAKISEIDCMTENSLKNVQACLTMSSEKVEEIKKMTDFVGGGSLGSSFSKRKRSLGRKARLWLFLSLVLFGGGSWWIYSVFTRFGVHTDSVWADVVINIAMSSMAVFALIFALWEYGKERKLQEEYAFRETIVLTLTACLEQLDACNRDDVKKLLSDTVEKLCSKLPV